MGINAFSSSVAINAPEMNSANEVQSTNSEFEGRKISINKESSLNGIDNHNRPKYPMIPIGARGIRVAR